MKRLPKISTVRNKCDALLTPIVKKFYPTCLLCGSETQVAHHFVKKSQSNRLRYELDNLIPLCHRDHQALHSRESAYSLRIAVIKGSKWAKRIDTLSRELVKTDVHWYLAQLDKLKSIYEQETLD
jgi:5-methylcytosine-specific restriction endonuclease McrA